jgi:hypothetical protein
VDQRRSNAVTHIRNGAGGLNGTYRLASGVTVFDDAAKDTLAGGTGRTGSSRR